MKSSKAKKLKKVLILAAYPVIWCVSLAYFWLNFDYVDAMGYSLIVIWFLIPIATFASSLCIALNNYLGKFILILPAYHGVMYMLTAYLTFSLANTLASGNLNTPDYMLLSFGVVLSLAGCGIGYVLRKS